LSAPSHALPIDEQTVDQIAHNLDGPIETDVTTGYCTGSSSLDSSAR